LLVLRALSGAFGSLHFNADVAKAAADDGFLVAIDIAEQLVAEGVPFRQAHEQVGHWVGEAVAKSVSLEQVVASDPAFSRFVPLFEGGSSLKRRSSPGASGPTAREQQDRRLRATIEDLNKRI
jgi:argininosuccinate lyase